MNYAYTRASLLIQAITCDMQEANIRAHADRIDHPIDKVFTDHGASGRTLKLLERPAGYKLLHTVQRGDHVFFSNIDRLGRGTVDILQTIDKFRELGVAVHVVDFGGLPLDLETAMGFAVIAMQAVFAEVSGKRISERTQEALKFLGYSGAPAGRCIPPGMKRTTKMFLWDARECAIVREIYQRIVEHGHGMQSIARDFFDRNLCSPASNALNKMKGRQTPWATPSRTPSIPGSHFGDHRIRAAYRWYSCLQEFGLDIEIFPAVDIAACMYGWSRNAVYPADLATWASENPHGLKESWANVQKLFPATAAAEIPEALEALAGASEAV